MQRISVWPDAPAAGTKIGICYDFSGLPSSVTKVTLKITSTPQQSGEPVYIEIVRGTGSDTFCAMWQTVSGTIGCTIEDTSGESDDYGVDFS